MVTEQLISPVVPMLMPEDTGNRALELMEENNLEQLPLVAEDKYMGLVQEKDLLDWDKPDHTLTSAGEPAFAPAVLASSHPFEAMRIAYEQSLTIVPVVDNDRNYLGAITRNELLAYITAQSGLNNPGGIIVLEIDPRNYSLYEIARICESEEVMLISTHVSSDPANGMLDVTLKTNRTNISGIAAALERHSYKVKEVFGSKAEDTGIEDRYKLLMNYINM